MQPDKRETLRLLIATALSEDALQIDRTLKNEGMRTRTTQVSDWEELHAALTLNSPPNDLLLVDIQLEGGSFDEVMTEVRKLGRDLPVIVLLPAYAEDVVTELLMAGAQDAICVHHHRHAALVIMRELSHMQTRKSLRQAESARREVDMRNRLLLDNSRDAIAYLHDGMHIYANQAYVDLFGYHEADDLAGLPFIDLVDLSDQSSYKEYIKDRGRHDSEAEGSILRFKGVHKNGDPILATMGLSTATYDGESCTQVIIRLDTGESLRAELEEKLREAANYDVLTGLGNRNFFEVRLKEALDLARTASRSGHRYALLYISIDRIKDLLTQYRMEGIDAIIQQTAERLGEQMGREAVFRFADTSFTVLLTGSDETSAEKLAATFMRSLQEHPVSMPDQRSIQASVSIGIVGINEMTPDAGELIARANAESTRASARGGSQICVYDPAQDASQSSAAMQELLDLALKKNQFKLLFQPMAETTGDGVQFFEVYLRLPLRDDEILEPHQFLSAAAAAGTGLASKIDRWVLLNASKRLQEQLKDHPNSRILINLSSNSLADTGLAAWVGKIAHAIQAPAGSIVLQFQENDVANYLNQTKALAESLRQVGCEISVSHFGCALSPFDILRHVDNLYVKIDGSFTQDLNAESGLEPLVEMEQKLHALNKRIIVPCVESATLFSKLWELQFDYLQGFFVHKPDELMRYEDS